MNERDEPLFLNDPDAELPKTTPEAADHEPLWEANGDLAGALEAVFTAAGEVMDIAKLRELTGFGEGALRQGIEKLQERLQPPCGLRLVEVGGGWRMATAPAYEAIISKLVTTVRSGRLTPAQLEALSIVAYRQPVTITEINAIRGVTSSSNQIKSLMERELIAPSGRKAVVGRPMMYSTTQAFLLHFGLKSLFDLPRLGDFGEGHLEAHALASLEPELDEGLFAHPSPEEAAEYDELPELTEEPEPEAEPPLDPDEPEPDPGTVSTAYKGWMRPGPRVPGGIKHGADETLDGLTGHWKIFQYAKGHRFSVDDLMAAWYGTTWCPSPARICDLGSGIGTLAMVAAWRCPGAVLHTVEAQEMSLALAKKSVAYNGIGGRFTLHHGDLRDEAIHDALLKDGAFDLVMGSPPYWPVTDRLAAEHPQAIPARLEVRGTIADYALAAAKLLAPGGVFACVFPNDQRERARAAYRNADLLLLHEREIIFKEGEAYGILLLAGSRRADFPPDFETKAALPDVEAPILIRRADGSVHPSIALARAAVGFPPGL